jgi:hypothetical protein
MLLCGTVLSSRYVLSLFICLPAKCGKHKPVGGLLGVMSDERRSLMKQLLVLY